MAGMELVWPTSSGRAGKLVPKIWSRHHRALRYNLCRAAGLLNSNFILARKCCKVVLEKVLIILSRETGTGSS